MAACLHSPRTVIIPRHVIPERYTTPKCTRRIAGIENDLFHFFMKTGREKNTNNTRERLHPERQVSNNRRDILASSADADNVAVFTSSRVGEWIIAGPGWQSERQLVRSLNKPDGPGMVRR